MAMSNTKEELELKRIELENEVLRLKARRYDLQAQQWAREVDKDNASAAEHGIYTFYGEISSRSVLATISNLDEWSRRKPHAALTFIINSPGGSVIDGFALYDFLQELKTAGHHLTTVGIGVIASMGGIVAQAGDTRALGQNAFMLIHEITNGVFGKTSELEDNIKFQKKMEDKALDILSSRSSLSPKQIKNRWMSKDWWMSSEEALKHGFVDEVR